MKLYKLEAIRGLAAFYVVLHHTISENSVNKISEDLLGLQIGFLLRFGQEAVILFFVLSGFVINYSFRRSRDKTFKTYFVKRAARIYVPLLLVFLTSYLLASYNQGNLINPELKVLVLNILMLQDWALVKPNVITGAYMDNTPLWSLSYEWWFYMLYFPLVRLVKNTKTLHISVFIIAFTASLIYMAHPSFVPRIIMYLAIWWTGVTLSDLYMSNKLDRVNEVFIPAIGLTAPTIVLAFNVLQSKQYGHDLLLGVHPVLELRHFVFSLFIFATSLIWRKLNWIGFDRLIKPFLILAPISYAMYISHHPIMVTATYFSFLSNALITWITYFMFLIAFSWIVEIIVYRRLSLILSRSRNQ